MANKRQSKKQQKKKQQQQLINKGFKRKDVQQLSSKNLNKLTSYNIPQKQVTNTSDALKYVQKKEEQKAKKREYNRQYRAKKSAEKKHQRQLKEQALERLLGIPPIEYSKKLTAKFLDSLDLENFKNGTYKRDDFIEYVPEKHRTSAELFDWDEEYTMPEGKKLHFAFRSLNGEIDMEEELKRFSKNSIESLLSFLRYIKNMPLTGSRNVQGKKGHNIGSSGKAGEGDVKLITQNSLTELIGKTRYNQNRRSKTWKSKISNRAKKQGVYYQQSFIDYHWQYIRQIDENGRPTAYEKITGRKLLIIANAILWNLRENDREGWYNDFYSIAIEVIPELKNILP